jgi:hypothetical protein
MTKAPRVAWLALLSSAALACSATRSSDCAQQSVASQQAGVATGVCTCPSTDPTTGVVRCAEGYSHRPTAPACGAAPAASSGGTGGSGGASAGPFRADSFVDCTNDPHRCDQYLYGFCGDALAGIRYCNSGCVTDAECDDGMCWCNEERSPTGGVCVPTGACRLDRDCGDGFFCATYSEGCGELADRFRCQSLDDKCESSNDCAANEYCTPGPTPGNGGTGSGGPIRRQCEDRSGTVCSP